LIPWAVSLVPFSRREIWQYLGRFGTSLRIGINAGAASTGDGQDRAKQCVDDADQKEAGMQKRRKLSVALDEETIGFPTGMEFVSPFLSLSRSPQSYIAVSSPG
jgi:hypothetical protein